MRALLTQHALDQAKAMGVCADEVRGVLDDPIASWPSDTKPGVRLAHNGRLEVVYNEATLSILTVLWRSSTFLPDRHLPPEQQVSGWINLDAKGAEKLFTEWGFTVLEEKPNLRLWTHPYDPEKRQVPLSIPQRNGRANGKGTYQKGAQIVGLPVARFVKGVDREVLEVMHMAYLARKVDAVDKAEAGPDPFGIQATHAEATRAEIAKSFFYPEVPYDGIKVEEPPVEVVVKHPKGAQASDAARDAVLIAVGLQSVTANEIRDLTGLSRTHVHGVLGNLLAEGKVTSRPATREELPEALRPGQTLLYFAGTEVPFRTPTPTTVTVSTVEVVAPIFTPTVEETPVPATVSPITPEKVVVPSQADAHIYENTGMAWPDGGVVLRDSEGRLWVAQPLVLGK